MKTALHALKILALSLGFSSPAAAAAANFSMPLVDLYPNTVGSGTMLAIWSSADAVVPLSTTVGVVLPTDYSIPSHVSHSACNCVFLRHTSTSAGAWGVSEITVTAATLSGQLLSISVPARIYPGKFYIRFDASAGLVNPGTAGMSTLSLVDPAGNTTLSRGFFIRSSLTASALGSITGTVKDSTGKALPGALVMASDFDTYLPVSIAARKGYLDAFGTTQNVYSTAVSSDGSFNLSVPPGLYTLRAEVWRHKKGLLQEIATETAGTVEVLAGAATGQSFSLPPLP